ncbi:dehydrogenase/reductase SDR family member 7C-B-like isoform X4 [Festucalex cinctus]
MDANVTEVDNDWTFLKGMDPWWGTTILLVPCAVVLAAGLLHVYSLVSGLLSKSCVRNKVLLVSDALSALGKECASIFHKGGARLILCGKSWEKLQELSDDLLNASDPSVMDKLLMDNNYFGPVTLAKGVLPSMMSRRTGHLLVVNSIQGKLAVPFRTSYAASKHAVQAFFDCLRSEVEESGVSVSTINVTFISSHAFGKQKDGATKSIWSYLYTKKPLGVSPREAASEVAKTLTNKRKEVLMAPSLPKVALYTRSFFPNFFFAVMAAGVKDATNTKM